jgi:hypothetical protein
MDAFHNIWLCHFPRPIQVTLDSVTEFKSVFKEMCDNLGINCRPNTSYNPQGNVKLPHPQLRKPTYTQTFQRNLRATQVRFALACSYTVTLMNRPLHHLV